ncbi:tetratricopeptide repeat protein [Arachnia propionica]|uniref:Tetratricopeptide repeat protein n=1 Tax=Arachnia propionica TaxID=1750 RepID=A0A3P1T8K6_9ACTN|nr:tetratricopeptide repeat protein [Arachnia propionica]RRD05166.1 tetratricopeptide repeat protein [Arachnia propionica]
METERGDFTREDLVSFLSTAPDELKDWAERQLARFDAEVAADDGADLADLLPDHEDEEVTREPAEGAVKVSALERRTGVSRLNLVLVTLLAAAVVVIVQMAGRPQPEPTTGMPSNHPPIDASAMAEMQPTKEVDRTREAELKERVAADPSDLEARLELSTMYYEASLHQEVIPLLQQVLEQDPDHIDALIGLGAAEYRTNQYDAAEQHWVRVTELDPGRQEPWYSLGFLHMARTPADVEKARAAWTRVIEIDPSSRMAEEVSVLLKSLATPEAAQSSEG